MSNPLRMSRLRLLAGIVLLVLAIATALFVLPDASQRKRQQRNASAEAVKSLAAQRERVKALRAEEARITESRKRIDELLASMPAQSLGSLQWELSRRLYDLAQKSGVRLQALKYGAPSREGAKGTDLEVLDVDFTASGVYSSLKPFMLGLEDTRESKLPFAVVTAKLEESPDGAHINVTLRAFRRTGTIGGGDQ